MANENLKVTKAANWVKANYQYATDPANYGYTDYWMDGRGVIYHGSGDSEDLCFLLHSLLLRGGIKSDRLRTYHGYYQSPTILYAKHTWLGYKRPSDDEWVVIDPVHGGPYDITDIDALPKMLYHQYYITGYAWQNELVYVPIPNWPLHFEDAVALITLPKLTIEATAAPSFSITLTFPKVTALAYGGGYGIVTLTKWKSTGTGAQGKVGSCVEKLPTLTIQASGVTGIVGWSGTLGRVVNWNPGMEQKFVSGIANNWTKIQGGGFNGTFTEENTIVRSGNKSQKIVTSNSNAGLQQVAGVNDTYFEEGKHYLCEAWFYPTDGATFYFVVQIDSGFHIVWIGTGTINKWQRVAGTIIIPKITVFQGISSMYNLDLVTHTWYVDDIYVRELLDTPYMEPLEVAATGYTKADDGVVASTLAAIEAYATGVAEDRFEILRHSRW